MKKYGLLGKSLSHSFSKNFFTKYFAENKINAAYSNFEIAQIQEVKSILESGVHGLNVTIPFKEAIIPFLDEITDDAKQIGAVNVVQFKNGKTIGHNTDAFGFSQSIKPFFTNQH